MKSWADDLSLLCLFRRPGTPMTRFPFGLLSSWFLPVFGMRRKIGFRTKHARSSCTFSGFLGVPPGLLLTLSAVHDLDPKPPMF